MPPAATSLERRSFLQRAAAGAAALLAGGWSAAGAQPPRESDGAAALSEMTAPKAGTTAEVATKEWTANLLTGVNLVPSGVYAVNRSQERGCAYCNGG